MLNSNIWIFFRKILENYVSLAPFKHEWPTLTYFFLECTAAFFFQLFKNIYSIQFVLGLEPTPRFLWKLLISSFWPFQEFCWLIYFFNFFCIHWTDPKTALLFTFCTIFYSAVDFWGSWNRLMAFPFSLRENNDLRCTCCVLLARWRDEFNLNLKGPLL